MSTPPIFLAKRSKYLHSNLKKTAKTYFIFDMYLKVNRQNVMLEMLTCESQFIVVQL